MSENIAVGNRVCFVGGPEAGNVRIIPESHGDHIRADEDFLYRIWPMRVKGNAKTLYFAYRADMDPLQMYLEMWRDYSPAAQIKRGHETLTYSKLGKK